MNSHNLDEQKKSGGLDFLPDGAYNITELSDSKLKFDVKVDDMR